MIQNINVTQGLKGINPVVHVVQGDTGRILVAKVIDETISGTAIMAFERPDGNTYNATATINEDNSVQANLTADMLRISGKGKATFKITSSDGKLVSTFMANVIVEPSAGFEKTPSTANDKIYVYINGEAVEVAKKTYVDDKAGAVKTEVEADIESAVASTDTKIALVSDELKAVEISVFDKIAEPWITNIESVPYGWSTGYYSADIGDTNIEIVSSNNYIKHRLRIRSAIYPEIVDAAMIEFAPPDGYSIHVIVKNDGVVTEKYGHNNSEAHPESKGKSVYVSNKPGNEYSISLGKLDGDAQTKMNDEDFCESIKMYFYMDKKKKPYSTGQIHFTVTLSNEQTVNAVLVLPESYTATGDKTRLVAMLHGTAGSVTDTKWYNDSADWINCVTKYTTAGFAVFDVDGVYNHMTNSSPLALEAIDKAYQYICANYNIYDEILIHGVSMGGGTALSYAANRHNVKAMCLCAAAHVVTRTAGVDDGSTTEVAKCFGYDDTSAMVSDGYAGLIGYSIECKYERFKNGLRVTPNIVNDFAQYHSWRSEIEPYVNKSKSTYDASYDVETMPTNKPFWINNGEDLYIVYNTPFKVWQGTADRVHCANNKALVKAIRNAGGAAEIVLCEGNNHNDICYGKNNLIDDYVAYMLQYK